MGTYDTYKTDKTKEEEGVWQTMADGSRWRIARSTSDRGSKALRNAQREFKTLLRQCEQRDSDVPTSVTDKINLNWVVNGIVTDWEGVTGPDEEPLSFSVENVKQVLIDLPEINLEVLRHSMTLAHYLTNVNQQVAANLGKV